jgi:hypothetical protein
VELNCPFVEVGLDSSAPGESEGALFQRATRLAKTFARLAKNSARQVPLYCFHCSECGTFMPLLLFRGELRIAVVWTLFGAVSSAGSSVHRRLLFTRVAVCSAVSCG